MKKIRKEGALKQDLELKNIRVERNIMARANHPYIMELFFTF